MNKLLYLSLLIPLIGLGYLLGESELALRRGASYTVPVTGFDPRDLLKGHYITYRFRWNMDPEKSLAYFREHGNNYSRLNYRQDDCLCLTDTSGIGESYPVKCSEKNKSCKNIVKGVFRFLKSHSHTKNNASFDDLKSSDFEFRLGIEKYYVPEEHATKIEGLLREAEGSIKFRINHQKRAVLEDFFLDRKPWRSFID